MLSMLCASHRHAGCHYHHHRVEMASMSTRTMLHHALLPTLVLPFFISILPCINHSLLSAFSITSVHTCHTRSVTYGVTLFKTFFEKFRIIDSKLSK